MEVCGPRRHQFGSHPLNRPRTPSRCTKSVKQCTGPVNLLPPARMQIRAFQPWSPVCRQTCSKWHLAATCQVERLQSSQLTGEHDRLHHVHCTAAKAAHISSRYYAVGISCICEWLVSTAGEWVRKSRICRGFRQPSSWLISTWRGGCGGHQPCHHAAADVQGQAILPARQLLRRGLHLAVAGELARCQDCGPCLAALAANRHFYNVCIELRFITDVECDQCGHTWSARTEEMLSNPPLLVWCRATAPGCHGPSPPPG